MVGLLAKKILVHFTQKSLQELTNFTRKKNSGSQEGDGDS